MPVPTDGRTVGQIVVRSEANMVGYWNRPDLTADTLRDGWMWTGDLATWDADRYVFIVDRAKDMIISGGENIYSVQVEEAVNHHPAVLECAVIGVPDDEWGESVKAFVVLKPGTDRHRGRHRRDRPGPPRVVPEAALGRVRRRAAQGAHRQDPQARPARPVLGRAVPLRLATGARS